MYINLSSIVLSLKFPEYFRDLFKVARAKNKISLQKWVIFKFYKAQWYIYKNERRVGFMYHKWNFQKAEY